MSPIGNKSYHTESTKRARSRSLPSCEQIARLDEDLLLRRRTPLSGHELDRLNYHVYLQDFGCQLQRAANAIFPGDQVSRYSKVDVILLSWEDEDPKLPVSLEIKALAEVFLTLYGFEVEEWLIPSDNSHNKLQKKILQFLGDDEVSHLKIVYYAGHGKLTNHGTPAWTSWQNSRNDRCPTVKWSGIQNTLEESRSDVLILLDCCASGVCTTDEGNGVTELIAACAYNAIANGVGPFSFTHALISRLRILAPLPYFPIGFLYNALFTEIQGWRVEDPRYKKVPVHLVLSQNNERPRSIRLSSHLTKRDQDLRPDTRGFLDTALGSLSLDSTSSSSAISSKEPKSTPNESFARSQTSIGKRQSGSWSPPSSINSLDIPEYPRLLFSIRIQEDVKAGDLSMEMFTDWLRDVPVSSCSVRVEAGFASDSTLLMVSMPAAMLAYLPSDPAVMMLGVIRSKNLMEIPCPDQSIHTQSRIAPQPTIPARVVVSSTSSKAEKKTHDPIRPTQNKPIVARSNYIISKNPIHLNHSESSPKPGGRLSLSTIGTTSSGTAQSASTLPDETFSDGRASVMTSLSSVTTGSQYGLAISAFRRPKHDPIKGIWNDVLRVIPCGIDHSGYSWDAPFQICPVCGFSQWHCLMSNAQSMNVRAFTARIKILRTVGSPMDFAGNSSYHYLMSTGCNLEYLTSLHHLEGESYIYDQNVFGQNPLHVVKPDALRQELIKVLEWFKIVRLVQLPPGLLLNQRDIYGRTPLQALLCHPLDRELYPQIYNVFLPFTVQQLRGFDTCGRTILEMMTKASLKIKKVSEDDNRLDKGITEIKSYLASLEGRSHGSSHIKQEYGFHDIARGARGTTFAGFFECRICGQVNAHSNSYLDQMKCACAHGRDRAAPDASGLTPAHALITCKRAAIDGTHESSAETAELFKVFLPVNDATLREVLHVLDPEGNSLVHNVAVRGFHEILEYILLLERPTRRRAMVNACAKNHKGEEISVLAAVEEEVQKITERIRGMSGFLMSRDTVRFLSETKTRLFKVKEILQMEGAEMNPSATTRWCII